MEKGLKGMRRALYHPAGQSAAVETPEEQRSLQGLNS